LSRLGLALVAVALAGLVTPGPSRLFGDGTLGWAIDLATHWVWLWLPLGAAGLLLARWRWPVRSVVAGAMALLPWWWLPPALPSTAAAPQLRVAAANVHLSNRDPAPLLAWAAAVQADVVAVLELTPPYAAALSSSRPGWPHQHLRPRLDSFGIGLLSRWPLRDVREVAGPGDIPQLHALVDTPDGVVEVIALHPMPPVDARWHDLRNRTFAAVAPRGPAPALLLGDFNATPWSNAAPLLAAGGWRWAGGVRPTWPNVPAAAWGIPIDAVWAHGPWELVEHAVGPPIGSDHRPVLAALRRATLP
jgi:endonuclease/exonuclease/phosphatase (EEP) superfamily protein YafD